MEVDAAPNPLLEKFSEVVFRVLKSWTGYQLALKHQMGGAETREKDKWFHEVLTEYLYSHPDLEIFEVAEWVDELLFNDFNLVLEDGSSDDTAKHLIQCAKWLRTNDTDKITEFLSKLPPDDRVLSATAQSSKQADGEESDSSSEESDGGEPMEEQTSETPVKEKQPKTVTDEDGWTTILPKNK